jgi:uncharacterized protein (UPF0216 family)
MQGMTALSEAKDTLDRAFDAMLSHEIRRLNTHLPRQRLTMSELLKKTDPTIETVDGSVIVLRTVELEELAKIVPGEYQSQLRLPIIVLRRMELGRSIFTVGADRVEEFTVNKILGRTDADYHEMYRDQSSAYLYRPEVVELLRKYHSLFVIGFGVPRELSDYVPNRD